MNQTFQFSRWWMLVTRQWAEHKRRYILSLIAIGGILLAADVFFSAVEHHSPMDNDYQLVSYYTGLFVAGCLYASTIYAELGNKKAAIQYLIVPASTLEKMLCAWFYSTVLFFVAWLLVFYIVDSTMVLIIKQILLGQPPPKHGDRYLPEIVNVFGERHEGNDEARFLFFFMYFALQGAFMLGSVYFPRFSVVKTVLSLVGILIIAIVFEARIVNDAIPEGWHAAGLFRWQEGWRNGKDYHVVANPLWLVGLIIFVLKYLLGPLFWYITYMRVKEKVV